LWVQTKYSYGIGAECGIELYRRTLYQSYAIHTSQNSSELISGITSKINNIISNALNPVLVLISTALMLFAIGGGLIYFKPVATLAIFGLLSLIYIVIIRFTKKTLIQNGIKVSKEQTLVIKSIQEGLGGIRDVLIDGSQPIFTQIYATADIKLRQAQANIFVIGNAPRFIIETLGVVLIVTVAYLLTTGPEGFGSAIPTLGVVALSTQRLLPLLQNAYASWASLQGGLGSLADTITLLQQPLPSYLDKPVKPIPFQKSLALDGVSFRYNPSGEWIIRDLFITIPKGARVGIIGPTGCGKSTILDLIMGLLTPTKGRLLVDGQPIDSSDPRSWQSRIAHVPQTIFLADLTIAENIAFGTPKPLIDYERVRIAARQAALAITIESWPDSYDTFVGERGVRLSGGQRQRIGIARALYKRAEIIIFDEATSALDNSTEQSIIEAINALPSDVTSFSVAHRLTTLRHADLIFKISEGRCVSQGSYADLIG